MSDDAMSAFDAVLLMGPTGSGKSALALDLARRVPLEIVSVDSALVYRGMDIGTSKPDAGMRADVPHHLVDVCDPSEVYSAGRFRREALELIAAIRRRGHVPLLVGGTMLYFHALMRGIAPLPEADPAVRAALDQEARTAGWPALHAQLAQLDPAAAARIRVNDAQRIQRALEVIRLTGRPLSELQQKAEPTSLRLARYALLPCGRDSLYARIDARFDEMLASGLAAEVRRLYDRGDLHADLPSMRAVGYRQLWQHFAGKCTLPEAISAAKQATRNLAKRQLTWLRGDAAIDWLRSLEDQELGRILEAVHRSRPV